MNLLKKYFSFGQKMNHKHVIVPISEQGTDHCEETTSLKDEVDVEMGLKPYDINDDPCIRMLNFLYKFVLVLFFISSFISLIKLCTGYNFYYEVYDMTMLNTNMVNSTFNEPSISASLTLGSVSHTQSSNCEDYKFGCCEIYDTCSDSSGEFIATGLTIDPRVVHKHDEVGTNCPRVIDMINDYVDIYDRETTCSSSEFGCCELNFICDMREYYRNFYNESSYIVTKTYQSNMKHEYISKSMAITKVDNVGSNCPKHYDLIMEYENGNLDKKPNIYMFFISLMLWVLSIVICYLFIHSLRVSFGNVG